MTNETFSNKPIGLLGGTFNPIHHGHLRLALELYERLDLAEVRLIPSAQPPHRTLPSVSSELRFEMVKAAIAGVNGLTADDRELQRSGLSYTIDTLGSLREEYPEHPLCLILGLDAFLGLPKWFQWERLLDFAHIVVVERRQAVVEQPIIKAFWQSHQASRREDLKTQVAGTIWREENMPILDISATEIREMISSGKNPCYLLPSAVLNIIHTHQLYC
jgi:nicotinate-nucleotide adenylyltransferase